MLVGVDRTAALFVARHHPMYYSHLRGCGFAEAFVAAVPEERVIADVDSANPEGSSAKAKERERRKKRSRGDDEYYELRRQGKHRRHHRHHRLLRCRRPHSHGHGLEGDNGEADGASADGNARRLAPPPSSSSVVVVPVPVLVLQLICGRLVRCDWEKCFRSDNGKLKGNWFMR